MHQIYKTRKMEFGLVLKFTLKLTFEYILQVARFMETYS